ncbi:hypothetical protein C8J56DRAFT_1059731 [Mycena floridula]|nr:hypothetical protein C8J56DRAFT_1059731 [Mycena floridula]
MGKNSTPRIKKAKKMDKTRSTGRSQGASEMPVPATPVRRSARSGRILRTPATPDSPSTPTPAPRKAGARSRKRATLLIEDSPATSPTVAAISPASLVPDFSSPENSGPEGNQENSLISIFSTPEPVTVRTRFASMVESAKPKNRWVSKNNALHGYVQNVHVGTQEYSVPRHRALRQVHYTEGKSARRFSRLMNDAEKVYHETGAWLHVVAQHPHAKQAHLSYISPRLRREAKEEDLLKAHKQIASLIYSCKAAHRHTAQQLSSKLAAREEELETAKKQLEDQAALIRQLSSAV